MTCLTTPHIAHHEAVLYSSPTELAGRLAPPVQSALAAGERVVAVLDETCAAGLSLALGAHAGPVEFQDPAEVHSVPAFTVATRWARLSRAATGRTTVIGQEVVGLPGGDSGHWARLDSALNVAIAGLPITVLCPRRANGTDLSPVRATHPALLTADGPQSNPAYRPPHETVIDYPPPPPPDLGPPATELPFGLRQLAELRHLVGVVAGTAGLPAERVADLVLAVNEIATNTVEHGPGAGRLRLWTAGGITVEVTDSGRMDVPFPGLVAPPTSGKRGRGLWLASELSDVMQVWSGDTDTVIRLQVIA